MTSDDTAIAGEHYLHASGTLVFGDGEIIKYAEIPIIGDDTFSSSDAPARPRFKLELFNPAGVTLSDPVGTVVIEEDDPRPTLALGPDVAVDEGNAGIREVPVDVTLTGALSVPVTVSWSASTGTAGSLTFEPHETRKSFIVTYTANEQDDGDRVINLSLSANGSVDSSRSSGVITIRDDDGPSVLRPPSTIVATATSATSVVIEWAPPQGATGYEVWRTNYLPWGFTKVASAAASPFTDATAVANTAYLYQVRAINDTETSGFSRSDFAYTRLFSDDPIVPRVTAVRTAHFTEIYTAVAALRTVRGIGNVAMAGPSGQIIASHVNQLRVWVASALTGFGMAAPSFTDPRLLMNTTTVKAAHLMELRNALR